MLGRAYSIDGKRFNVVILAGGKGTRMGAQSDYIPKALSQIGRKRAIDYIIERYLPVANKFVIGTGTHHDLLESYVTGRYAKLPIEFSRESDPQNNGISLAHALDKCDIDFPTVVLFCDLIVVSNFQQNLDTILVAGKNTKGNVGTFRHRDGQGRGILGCFSFSRTDILKEVTYAHYSRGTLQDITENVLTDYNKRVKLSVEECAVVYEFGNQNDLETVRKLWENG